MRSGKQSGIQLSGKKWLRALALVAAVGAARSANATYTGPAYDAHGCLAKSKVENDALVRTAAGIITNSSATDIVVFCPVIKKTSGPGISTDQVVTTTIPFQGTSALACDLQTFVVATASVFGGTNFVDSFFGSATTSPLVIDSSWSSTPQGFWDGYQGHWYYDDIRCDLPAGASLKNYTITENGTQQPYQIYAPDACTPDGASNSHWRYLDYFGGFETLGGSIYADASGGAGKIFRFDCGVAPSSRVDFAVGPAFTSETLGCSFDATATPQTWPSLSQNGNSLVYNYLPISGSPYIFIPSGSHKLVCDITPTSGNGDGRLDSFRTSPGPIATGTPTGGGSTAAAALDHSLGSRWTTGTSQAPGQSFQINFGTAISFNKLKMDSNGTNDYAHGYQVFVSNDGVAWGSAIATGTGTSSVITVSFATQTKKWVRVVQTATDTAHWWSIHELSVYKN